MKDKIINLIITACETEDKDFLDVASGIVAASDNKFHSQIDIMMNKVYEASLEDRSVEGLLDVVYSLLEEGGSGASQSTPTPQPRHEPDNSTGGEVQYTPETSTGDVEDDGEDRMSTKSIPVNKRKRGKNLFDPNDYRHLYHDEDHKMHKAASRPTPKPQYKSSLVTVNCTGCNKEMQVPQEYYAGEGTGLKCEKCLMG